MTVADVRRQLAAIREAAKKGDAEKAHVLEDAMRAGVLRAIAAGAEGAQGLAIAAPSSNQIRFGRFCS